MPIPRVFVSSTCYDLRYIREHLAKFIRSIGYEPVLSEEGAVYYNVDLDVHDSCIEEVPKCQMLVLIIGGRFGSEYKEMGKSITNVEYRKAVEVGIPIFALVERTVYEQYLVYVFNAENPVLNHRNIIYPNVDSTNIFDFIEEVKGQARNNAIFSFSNIQEIEDYLRKQWAGLTFSSLESKAKEEGFGIASSHEKSAKYNGMQNEQIIDEFVLDLDFNEFSPDTIRSYRMTIEMLSNFLNKSFYDADEHDLKSFLSFLRQEKQSKRRTISRHIHAIRKLFEFLDLDTAKNIKSPKFEKEPLESLDLEELRKLLESISNVKDLAIVYLLSDYGLSTRELSSLDAESFRDNKIHIKQKRKDKERSITIQNDALRLLKRYLKERTDNNPALFLNRAGRRITDTNIQQMIRKHRDNAGIQKRVTASVLKRSLDDFRRNHVDVGALLSSSAEKLLR